MPHKHITSFQRNELSALLRAKVKQKDIAALLNKDRITIWREKKRNKGKDGKYNAKIAKEKTKKRRIKANSRFKKIQNNKWLQKYIERKLKIYWSPEQISGRLKLEFKENVIGKDSIYKYIYEERKDLIKYLRCQKGKYRRRYGTKIREKQREEQKKRLIDTRPQIIERRSRLGDWERDTIVGGERKTGILTHVDRKSGYLLADILYHKTAESVWKTTVSSFKKIPKDKRKTIIYDNGAEFSSFEFIERYTKATIYFAYPYHSWERGTNENTNGLLRQFFPKKSLFAKMSKEDVKKVEKLINNRPRKRLNYLTPYEVFNEKRCCSLE